MILLIDNYDSFSYNLYQLIAERCPEILVVRNDRISVDEAASLAPEGIVLSPGPGRADEAGICVELVKRLGDKVPILGVCLGHQAICIAYGGIVSHAKRIMHGKQSDILIDGGRLFRGIEGDFKAGRYHSLEAVWLPPELEVTARTRYGEIMAVEHGTYPVYGVQFHPESILTPRGGELIDNFLKEVKR